MYASNKNTTGAYKAPVPVGFLVHRTFQSRIFALSVVCVDRLRLISVAAWTSAFWSRFP